MCFRGHFSPTSSFHPNCVGSGDRTQVIRLGSKRSERGAISFSTSQQPTHLEEALRTLHKHGTKFAARKALTAATKLKNVSGKKILATGLGRAPLSSLELSTGNPARGGLPFRGSLERQPQEGALKLCLSEILTHSLWGCLCKAKMSPKK